MNTGAAATAAGWIRVTGSTRPNFLVLTPICILLGTAVAWYRGVPIAGIDLLLVFLGGLMAHASVNLLNEYEDFRSGLDDMTERTPFSGGSGTLQAYPALAERARIAGWVALTLTGAIGVYFAIQHGAGLIPLGLVGLLLIGAYTSWITRHPLICLVAPGLGFGPLMVMGTEYVLTGSYSWTGLLVSMTPFFLVSNLLLINQFPDKEPDQRVGRRHLPIAAGRRRAAVTFTIFLLAAYVPPLLGLVSGWLPTMAGLALLTVPAAVPLALGVIRNARDIPKLVPYLGLNVVLVLLTPALFAVGLFMA